MTALRTCTGTPTAGGASTRSPTASTKEVGEDVSHRGGIEVEVAEATKAGPPGRSTRERSGAAVVLLALLGIAKHVVGLGDLLEALLRLLVVGVAVGVVLTRELAVGLLDLLGARLLVDPERLVVIRTRCHSSSDLRGHQDPGGADDRLAHAVAVLVDLGDGAAGGPLYRLLGHRFLLVGIEGLAERRERLDAHTCERGGYLRAHQAHPGEQRILGLSRLDRAVEVVERRQELLGEFRHATVLRLSRVARHALAVVLEVSLGALCKRKVLITLGGGLQQLASLGLERLAV